MHDFSAVLNNGEEISLKKFEGQPCIVVNVASKWGATDSEYKALNELHEQVSYLKIFKLKKNKWNLMVWQTIKGLEFVLMLYLSLVSETLR